VVQSGDMAALVDAVLATGRTNWDRAYAMQYILDNHTWDKRVAVYDQLLRRKLPEIMRAS
jgi:hypothetical protein